VGKHWFKVLFFAVIVGYFLYGLAPDMSWESLGADMASYVVAATTGAPAGLSGNPLYILLGSLLVRLPTNPFWSLGLLSTIGAVGTCIVIFLIVSKLTVSRWAPYIASLVFATAFAAWAESVIAETYTLATLIMSLTLYLAITRRYYWMGILMALSLGTHPLALFATIPCLVWLWFDKKDLGLIGRVLGIAAFGLLFRVRDFIAQPVTANLFYADNAYENILNSAGGYFGVSVIPFAPTWQRIQEVYYGLGSSLWTVPFAIVALLSRKKEVYLLVSVGLLAGLFSSMSIYPQWIKYLIIPTLSLAILAGIGIDRLKWNKSIVVLLLPCLLFGALNLSTYSPGRTVDPQPTTMRVFYNSLSQLPDHALVVGHTWGYPDLAVYYYCVNSHDRIDYISYDTMTDPMNNRSTYKAQQKARGINYPVVLDQQGGTLGVSDFSSQLQSLNPGRPVFVTVVKSSKIPMEFSLVSASNYTPRLNDLPAGKIQFSGN
jgi:hypothetical protein